MGPTHSFDQYILRESHFDIHLIDDRVNYSIYQNESANDRRYGFKRADETNADHHVCDAANVHVCSEQLSCWTYVLLLS